MRTQVIIRHLATGLLAGALAVGAVMAPAFSEPAYDNVTLPGTGEAMELLRELAVHYMAQFESRNVIVPRPIGSDGAVRVVGTGESPVANVARKPTPEEIAKYGDLTYVEFARVPVAIVVGAKAGVTSLTERQVCDIYSGAIANWKQAGGNDVPVDVQAQPEDGATMPMVREKIACFDKLAVTPNAHPILRSSDAVGAMTKYPGAIGFMPLGEATSHGFPIVTIDGVAPTAPAYKLGIGLGFVYKSQLSPGMKAFLDFMKTDVAKIIIRRTGHVPVEG